jgi:hypothetical protein
MMSKSYTNPGDDFFCIGDHVRVDPERAIVWGLQTDLDLVYTVVDFAPRLPDDPSDNQINVCVEHPERDRAGIWYTPQWFPAFLLLCDKDGRVIDSWPYPVEERD